MKEFDSTVVLLGKVVFRNEGMAKLLKGSPEFRVIVGGHMDSTGGRECNMGLSCRRARAFGIVWCWRASGCLPRRCRTGRRMAGRKTAALNSRRCDVVRTGLVPVMRSFCLYKI